MSKEVNGFTINGKGEKVEVKNTRPTNNDLDLFDTSDLEAAISKSTIVTKSLLEKALGFVKQANNYIDSYNNTYKEVPNEEATDDEVTNEKEGKKKKTKEKENKE